MHNFENLKKAINNKIDIKMILYNSSITYSEDLKSIIEYFKFGKNVDLNFKYDCIFYLYPIFKNGSFYKLFEECDYEYFNSHQSIQYFPETDTFSENLALYLLRRS